MCSILYVFLFLSCASIASASDGRDVLIARQLDCVQEHAADTAINWNDVCFMGTRENHARVVTAELDLLESQPFVSPPQNQEWLVPQTNVITPDKSKIKEDVKNGPLQVETTFDLTHRVDNLNWSIGIPDGGPNVLSELTWKNIKIIELENSGRLTLDNRFILLDWRGGLGWVYRGKNQDSDYFGNDKTHEFSRSYAKSNLGQVYDLSGGGGLRFDATPIFSKDIQENLALKKLYLDVLGGYSYYQTQYYMTDGEFLDCGDDNLQTVGPFQGLKSNYLAQWKGPWIGGDLKGEMGKWHGLLRYEYHWLDYYGKANWNLRSDFQHPKSYEHIANGDGYVLMSRGGYSITPFWSVDVTTRWQYFRATTGTDRTFFSDGTSSEILLNESIWKSFALSVGNTFHF